MRYLRSRFQIDSGDQAAYLQTRRDVERGEAYFSLYRVLVAAVAIFVVAWVGIVYFDLARIASNAVCDALGGQGCESKSYSIQSKLERTIR